MTRSAPLRLLKKRADVCGIVALVALSCAVLALLGSSGCASDVKGPAGNNTPQCTFDTDCAAGLCENGTCSDAVPVGGGGEGEGSAGEGEGSGGEGEGSAGEGEGSFGGEGEGSVGGEGEGEGVSGGAQTLLVTAGPELVDALPGCACTVPDVPASNVDLAVTSSNGSCQHPSDPSCGLDGGKCPCPLGGTSWFASRQEEPRGTDDVWIVDEGVNQIGGNDGTLTITASVADDCLLAPGATDESVNFGCLDLDCEGEAGGPTACFDYTQLGGTCANAAEVAASVVTNADCMVRGPVPVRVHVEADGGAAFARDFCTTLNAGDHVDAVQLRRTNGAYFVANVSSQMTEVSVGAPCP